jgi:hypothetical protein
MTILILTLHFRGANTNRAPLWLRKLTIGKIGKVLFYNTDFLKQDKLLEKIKEQRRKDKRAESPKKNLLDRALDITALKLLNSFKVEEITNITLKIMIMKEILSCQKNLISIDDTIENQKSLEKNEKIRDEWKIIAVIIDRLCFILYFIAFVSTIVAYTITIQ